MSRKPSYEALEKKVRALEAQLSLTNQKLETLHSISSLKGADIQTISNHVLNSICNMTESRYGFYGFLDDDASEMNIHAWTDAALKDCAVKDRPKHFPIEKAGVWAEAIRSKKAYILNDYESYLGKKGAPEGHVTINNLLVVPILNDGTVISVVAVANKHSRYDQDDIRHLESLLFSIQALIESKLAAERVKENKKKFTNLVNNLPGTAYQFSIDPNGAFHFDYMGENCIDLFGISADEIMADANLVFDLIPQPDADKVYEAITRSARSLMPYNIEHRVIKKNGETVWIHASSIPRLQDDGSIIWDGIGLNITKKKQTEEELNAERFKLREYFENLPMLAYNVSFDGIIEDVNNVAVRILGYADKTELIGKPLVQTIYAPASQDKAKRLIKKWKDVKVLKNEELQIITKQGKTIDVLLNADTIFDHNGTPMHSLSTHLDITERKTIEKELRKSETLLLEAQRVAKFGHWELDSPSGTPLWSEEIFRIFGLDPETSAPSFAAHANIIHADDWDILEKSIDELNQSGKAFDLEFRIKKTNGDIGWMHAIGSAEKDHEGNVIRMFGTAQDVSDKKKTEIKLLESESHLKILVDTIPDLVWLKNPEGVYLGCNPTFEKFFGAKESAIVGKTDYDFVDKNLADFFRDHDSKAMEQDKPSTNEEWLTFSDGGYNGLFETIKTPMKNPEGKLIGVLGIARDITDRHENELRYKSAQRIGRVGNWEYNIAAGTIWGSEQAKQIFGFDPDSKRFTLDEIENCIPKRERVHQALIDLVEKDTPYNLEYEIHPVTGPKTKTIRSIAEIIRDDSGAPLKVLGVIQDITNQKKMERQIIQGQKMESIGNLAGGIAHDFNNILSSIIGFTELALDETPKGTDLEDSLLEVYRAGKRARDLVKQILAFARQSEEKRSLIQPSKVVKEVLKLLRSTIPTTIEIRKELDSDSWLLGNATQLYRVLMNLCTNAAHAMEDSQGVLEVSMKDVFLDRVKSPVGMRPGYFVEIKVSDTGVGISPQIIDSIFEPYFTTKGIGEGTGMGLAMAQGVIESHGGKITVDSQVGKGTTFTLYLPISKKKSGHGVYMPEQLPTGTERILFVDDEAPIAKMGSQMLERLGYAVTTRTSSIEALELFQARPDSFDLAVTDMTMPNLSGDKLSIELMNVRPDLPVILCTGYSKKISDETASEMGIKAFVYKPVVKADLAKIVRKVLDETTEIENGG